MALPEFLKGWFWRAHAAGKSTGLERPSTSADAAAAEKRLLEGAEYVAQGRFADAERAVARALELRHDYVEALLLQSAIVREQGRLDEAADYLALAAHFRPDSGEVYYQLGVLATAQGRVDEAEKLYRQSILKDPLHAKAHNFLGALLAERGAVEKAAECFRRSVTLRPDFAPAHSNLGALLITQLDRFDEGAKHIEEAIRLAPDSPDVQCNRAMLLQYQGRYPEALHRWTELIEAGVLTNDAKARLDRALIFLLQGDFATGWDEYEYRFDADRRRARDFELPRWDGSPLAGRSILVHAEQGVGDEIMFASCLPDLIAGAGRVFVECSERLERLFSRSFPQAVIHAGEKSDSPDWLSGYYPIDYQVPIGSLPRKFRRSPDAFPGQYPYLKADPARVEDWRKRLHEDGPGPAIGISWRGGTAATRSAIRSVPADLLVKFLPRDVTWVSLQHGVEIEAPPLPGLRAFPGVTQDLDELAALMGALDLVVSVANTNVHLAGALGRPVWVLVSNRPEWRYGASGECMPWYPSSKLFRCGQHEDWEAVLGRLRIALDCFIKRSGSPSAAT